MIEEREKRGKALTYTQILTGTCMYAAILHTYSLIFCGLKACLNSMISLFCLDTHPQLSYHHRHLNIISDL